MNDIGSLATSISNYGYLEDTGAYPVEYISGWLEVNVGQLNALTLNETVIDDTGAFDPCLTKSEESMFSLLFEIGYYSKSSRDALRNLTYGGGNADWTSFKEGDTSIQRVNKNSVARSFFAFSEDARSRLDQMLNKYLMGKASPVQVAGDDA